MHKHKIWAPIMKIPNGWVNVGTPDNTCKLYNSIHPHPPLWGLASRHFEKDSKFDEDNVKVMTTHIMSCRKPSDREERVTFQTSLAEPVTTTDMKYERDILGKMHPIWFLRKYSYHSRTHDEAVAFCESIVNMVLCPAEAFCLETSNDTGRLMFLRMLVFNGGAVGSRADLQRQFK